MKTNYLKFGVFALAASLTLGTVSCKKKGCTDETATNYDEKAKKDDGSCEFKDVAGIVNKAGFITANETWTADNIYKLTGKVVVNSGVTLTIEPGTIIKGNTGEGSLASALVVARGGKIMANGTASQPIIFTSVLDNIAVGQTSGTNLTETDQGKWGGVIILGYAPISAADGDDVAQIEGISADDPFGAYGGTNAADNSGTLNYVSIRHGGALIGAGNEINGLTLGGVGSGTTISNIEVVSNLDDGVEFFGGTVNATNVVVGFQGDDGIDVDMNYAGTVENFIVVNGSNSDEALEIDGPENTLTDGLFTLKDGNCYKSTGGAANGDFKSKAQGTVNNVKFGKAKIRVSFGNDCTTDKTDAYTYLTQASPILVFTSSEFTETDVYTKSQDSQNPLNQDADEDNDVYCPIAPSYDTNAANAMTSSTVTVPATSTFSWTWMSQKGKF